MYKKLGFFKSFRQTRSKAPLKVTPGLKDAAEVSWGHCDIMSVSKRQWQISQRVAETEEGR